MKFWQCPPTLVLVMGIFTVIAMISAYTFSYRFTDEPQLAALFVILITALFLVVGNLIIVGFNKVAEANRMKSEFVSIVSHQLRSPLSIFKWTVDVVEREMQRGRNGENVDNFIKTIRDTTENMIRMVNSLLEVSRIEARTFMLAKESLSLVDLARGVVRFFESYAKAANIALEFSASENLPAITGDRDRIIMVIQNLVDNAIRYSKGGAVYVSINKEGNFLRFAVKDSGVGIPESQRKNIFKKFFRAPQGLRFQTEGTGIGLYIAKSIVEASGGKIGFISEEGKGSTFWFILPIAAK